jgi:TolA-binding protein
MRVPSLVLLLLATVSMPALAQKTETVDQRLQRVEKELRAVQRKVFPGGTAPTVEPEIRQSTTSGTVAGAPATNAVADMAARLDAIEMQLRTLTGQAEENSHRLSQIEQALSELRAGAAPPPGPVEPPRPASASESPLPPPPVDSAGAEPPAAAEVDLGEQAYVAGYRLWTAGKYAEAQQALEAMVKQYPKHPRASFAQNLLGRAYLDGGKPATAAKVFLANYQNDPKGERAPDSLYFLGQALVKLDKRNEACRVYDELQDVYGTTMRGWVKERLPQARGDARCG